MKFAISIPDVGSPQAIVELAVEAEQAGWDAVFLWDHLQLFPAMELNLVDPWVTLGAIAQVTERVRLGVMVTPIARRRPQKLAKELITLDHLSAGRVICGIGLGFPDHEEFGAFGEDEDRRVRADRTDEALGLLDRFLRGGPVDHAGPHYQVHAQLRPAALQQPRPPIWIAAMAPFHRPLTRAARWDGVVPISSTGEPMGPDELATYLADHLRPPGYDVVASRASATSVEDYHAAGATWLVDSVWPEGDWYEDLRGRVLAGPPAR